VEERERIAQRRAWGQDKPWSDDPVFQTTYFCNINREDDKVTRWIRLHYELEAELAAFNMIIARFVNKPDSLEKMGWPFTDWTGFERSKFEAVMSQPGSWGGAYIVSTNGRRQRKHEYIAGLLDAASSAFLWATPATLAGTLAGAHRALQGVSGLASFMAAQVVADLKNTEGHWLQEAEDWHTFAAPGPGSLRGLEWFHEEKITASKFAEALASARSWMQTNGSTLVDTLCNQDLQNCFCEYDKYMRVATGTGRSKRKYNGR
jgi:hypothetical protein